MYPRIFLAVQTIVFLVLYTLGCIFLVVPKHPSQVNGHDVVLVGILFVPLTLAGMMMGVDLARRSAEYIYGMTPRQLVDLFRS